MELPAKGAKFAKGGIYIPSLTLNFGLKMFFYYHVDAFCTLESVKAVSECYLPVSGTIYEVNGPLSESPNLINKSPFEQGKEYHLLREL